jgi:trans-2,3-dihydro-3-hydroxyanthranilate isomerase
VLTLSVDDICTDHHLPVVASVGLGFVVVELNSVQALQSIKLNTLELEALSELMVTPFIHAYVRTHDEFDIRARMFAPTDGVPEDPATGSANCALAGLLGSLNPEANLVQTLRIAQGVEMGRPSELFSKIEKVNGDVTSVKIGGYAVTFCEGELTV